MLFHSLFRWDRVSVTNNSKLKYSSTSTCDGFTGNCIYKLLDTRDWMKVLSSVGIYQRKLECEWLQFVIQLVCFVAYVARSLCLDASVRMSCSLKLLAEKSKLQEYMSRYATYNIVYNRECIETEHSIYTNRP